MNLPLPPPAADGDEPISRVRMSGLVADHTARAVPALPFGPGWDIDDTTDEDREFDSVTAAVRMADEPDALAAARRADRQTVAGVKTTKSARRLPLTADESSPVPRLPEEDEQAPKLPAPPPMVPQRLPEPPRGPDAARLPLRAAPNTPPSGHPLPRLGRTPPGGLPLAPPLPPAAPRPAPPLPPLAGLILAPADSG